MRLLFITPQLPYPPQKGTATRNFNIIKNLAQDHEVHLISLNGSGTTDAVENLRRLCKTVQIFRRPSRSAARRIRDLFLDPKPDLATRLASEELARGLKQALLTGYFDVLQIEGLEMAWHWRLISKGEEITSRVRAVVLDEHNAEYLLQRRAYAIDRKAPTRWIGAMYSWVQTHKLIRYEADICRSVDAVVTVSEGDRAALEAIAPIRRIAVVHNGVDVEYFAYRRSEPQGGPPTLLFTGTMDFRPNIDAILWFAKEVLPLIHRQLPETVLYIVGREPAPGVVKLGHDSSIVVTGFVEDIRDYFQRASVYVVPMRFGGGIRFKVLEAMAAGVPVVSTTMGAEGIEATPGKHVIIADDPPSFADWVVRLLRDTDLRQSLSRNARSLVERKYDWRMIVPKLEALYAAIV